MNKIFKRLGFVWLCWMLIFVGVFFLSSAISGSFDIHDWTQGCKDVIIGMVPVLMMLSVALSAILDFD